MLPAYSLVGVELDGLVVPGKAGHGEVQAAHGPLKTRLVDLGGLLLVVGHVGLRGIWVFSSLQLCCGHACRVARKSDMTIVVRGAWLHITPEG
jgi:hypothetical protein